ncbi:MAG: T9SS type A sorting domain-containing protein [Bacteroidetes bacterium]|nr:T9SS type A sorting domain-containing protein [Bacteroidota bacterium]
MKKIILLFATILFTYSAKSQCAQNSTEVLVLGDSWGAFTWENNSHNINFDKYGLSDKKAFSTGASVSPTSNTDLTHSGVESNNYLTSARKVSILNALNSNPNIKIVHISLGGNDFINNWDTTWTQAQIDTLTQTTLDSITSIINFLRQQKPSLKIFLSTYDYPNFEEVINGSTSHPFYGRWNAMKKPSFYQVNKLLSDFNVALSSYITTAPDLYFVNTLGLMQYYFGQTYNLPYAPFGSYPALTAPLPNGYINYPSPMVAMNTYLMIIKDAFHLSPTGFEYLIGHQVKNYYFEELRNYDITTKGEHLKCGYANANNSFGDSSIIIGNVNNVKHVGLLSFTVPTLNSSKSVGKASIFLKRKGLVGTNPIGSYSFNVEMTADSLGNSSFPDNMDFSASVTATATACNFGSVSGNDYWLRLDLPQSMAQQLTSNTQYQFKVGIVGNNSNANQALLFYSDSTSNNAPFIDIFYTTPLSINDNTLNNTSGLSIYPNPAASDLSVLFTEDFSGSIELVDILGNKLTEVIVNTNSQQVNIKLPNIANGIYFILAKNRNTNKIITEKIVVENK